jgi:hypothetical protein
MASRSGARTAAARADVNLEAAAKAAARILQVSRGGGHQRLGGLFETREHAKDLVERSRAANLCVVE